MISELLGMTIGFMAVCGTLLLLLIMVVMDNKTRRIRTRFLHDERMLALEKGLPIPMDYAEPHKKRRPYRNGLIFAAIGLAFLGWGIMSDSEDLRGLGMIPLFVGGGLIIADLLNERRSARSNKAKEQYDAERTPYRVPDSQT